MIVMKLNDNYIITAPNGISEFDKSVVMWLYQPIMGVKAFAMYNIFIEELAILTKNKFILSVRRLAKISGLSELAINQANSKLESLGLLKIYYRATANTYNFRIQPPIAPESFFEDTNLSSLLFSKIGEIDFEYAKLRFSNSNINSTNADKKDTECNLISKPVHNTILNFSLIDQILIKKKIDLQCYIPYKKSILNLAIFYKVATRDVVKLMIESIKKKPNEDFIFDLNYFSQLMHDRYELQVLETYETSTEQLRMEINENNEVTNMSMLDAKINEMSTIEPVEYLSLLKDNEKITNEELEMISNLILKYKLRPSVVNCLVEFVYFKNYHRIEPNYAYKIASTLRRLQLTSVIAVMEHLKSAFKNRNQKFVFQNAIKETTKSLNKNKLYVKNNDSCDWNKNAIDENLPSTAEMDQLLKTM